MKFIEENGQLINTNSDGVKTRLFCCGFDSTFVNRYPREFSDMNIRLHSATIKLDTNGDSVGEGEPANDWIITIPFSEFSGDIAGLQDKYVDEVYKLQDIVR